MEEMSHKSELVISREQQLARLREATGTPERYVLDFACARHDRAFRVTFARFSPAQRFRCESVDKDEPHQATAIAWLQGLLRPAEALRVRTEEMDFSSVPCAWCAAASGWTLCPNCKTLICGARSSGRSFTCRDSCGAQFQTAPLEALDAARQAGRPHDSRSGIARSCCRGKVRENDRRDIQEGRYRASAGGTKAAPELGERRLDFPRCVLPFGTDALRSEERPWRHHRPVLDWRAGRRDPDFQDVASDNAIAKPRVMRCDRTEQRK
jgi:hypothetical protein